MTKVAGIIEESGNDKWTVFLPQTYGNIGHNLIAENQLEKGIAYEKKALLIKNYPDEQRYRTMLHLDITDASIKLKNIPQATMHLDSARQLERVVNNIPVSYTHLDVYKRQLPRSSIFPLPNKLASPTTSKVPPASTVNSVAGFTLYK